MYEHKTKPILPLSRFFLRVVRHFVVALALIAGSLAIGILGYQHYAGLPFVDSLLNASMILGGMGPVDVLTTNTAKIFAACYALFSGIVFLAFAGIIIAPVAHRILHRMHEE